MIWRFREKLARRGHAKGGGIESGHRKFQCDLNCCLSTAEASR